MFKKKNQKETRKVPCFPDNHNLLQLVHWGVNQQAFKVTVIWSGEFLDLELKRKKLVKINVENKGSIDLSACLNCEAAENRHRQAENEWDDDKKTAAAQK